MAKNQTRIAEMLGEKALACDFCQAVLARDLAFEDAKARLQTLESWGTPQKA